MLVGFAIHHALILTPWTRCRLWWGEFFLNGLYLSLSSAITSSLTLGKLFKNKWSVKWGFSWFLCSPSEASWGWDVMATRNTFAAIPSLSFGLWYLLLIQSDSTINPLAKWQNKNLNEVICLRSHTKKRDGLWDTSLLIETIVYFPTLLLGGQVWKTHHLDLSLSLGSTGPYAKEGYRNLIF